jgi:hypothetical protein
MDSFGIFFPIFMVVMFGLVALFIGAVIAAGVKRSKLARENRAAPEVTAVAAVVDKHIDSSGGGDSPVVEHHLVSFEQPGGERFELEVPANEYGMLVVGDRGSVTMKGTQYRGFARELMR